MNRLDFQLDGAGGGPKVESTPQGASGAALMMVEGDKAGFAKTLSIVPSYLAALETLEVIESLPFNSSKAAEALAGAAGVCALPSAIVSTTKTCKDLSKGNYWQATANGSDVISKTAEFALTMHKSEVFDLGKTWSFIAKSIKGGFAVITDAFKLKEAYDLYNNTVEDKWSPKTQEVDKNSRLWGLSKAIAAIVFHVFSFVATLFTFSVNPFVGLGLATVYTVTAIGSHFVSSAREDARYDDIYGALSKNMRLTEE